MIDPLNRRLFSDGVRHECGHLIVAKELGLTTAAISMETTINGTWKFKAGIDLPLSLMTKDDVIDFIEKRVAVLYAGVLAETLHDKKIQNSVALQRFRSSEFKASTDYAKVREICRIWVGLKHPGTPSEFQDRLDEFENGRYNKAAELVQSKADQIQNLVTFFVREWEKAGEPPTYELSKEKIDVFLAR